MWYSNFHVAFSIWRDLHLKGYKEPNDDRSALELFWSNKNRDKTWYAILLLSVELWVGLAHLWKYLPLQLCRDGMYEIKCWYKKLMDIDADDPSLWVPYFPHVWNNSHSNNLYPGSPVLS
jgi:hypothetical protein